MRWIFLPGKTRNQLVRHLVDTHVPAIVAHALKGNTLWAVAEAPTGRQIVAFVLRYNMRVRGYGYRAVAETDMPLHYDCPLALLQLAPEARAEWRRHVENHHALHAARPELLPAVGEVWSLTSGPVRKVEIVEVGRKIIGQFGRMRLPVAKRQLGVRLSEAPVEIGQSLRSGHRSAGA
jgi:hypothetical protein